MENQMQVFHTFHRPLKIPQNRRDFHISTAWACTAWKSGKPKTGFPLCHPVHAMTMTVVSLKPKNQRKRTATRPPHDSLCRSPSGRAEPIFHAHLSIGKCSPASNPLWLTFYYRP